jgi:hypothetical protein
MAGITIATVRFGGIIAGLQAAPVIRHLSTPLPVTQKIAVRGKYDSVESFLT